VRESSLLSGLGAHYAGPRADAFVYFCPAWDAPSPGFAMPSSRPMIPLAGSALLPMPTPTLGEFFAWIIGWGPHARICYGAPALFFLSGWSNHFIELLNIFHVKKCHCGLLTIIGPA